MICPNCGANVDDNSNECFLCGYVFLSDENQQETFNDDISEQTNNNDELCSTCGAILSDNDEVCPICGTQIERQIFEPQIVANEDISVNSESSIETVSAEHEKKQTSLKVPLMIIISICLILCCVICLMGYYLSAKKDNKESSQADSSSVTTKVEKNSEIKTTTSNITTTTTTTKTRTNKTTTTKKITTTTRGKYESAVIPPAQDYISTMYVITTDENVNFRIGPGYNYNKVDNNGIPPDTPLDVLYESYDYDSGEIWAFVKYNGKSGWVTEKWLGSEPINHNGGNYLTKSNSVPYTVHVDSPIEINIYEGPGYNYNVVERLPQPNTYTIVEETSTDNYANWWGKLKSGVGWINLEEVYHSSFSYYGSYAKVTVKDLRLREYPSLNAGILIKSIPKNTLVEVIKIFNEWAYVSIDGNYGWIMTYDSENPYIEYEY